MPMVQLVSSLMNQTTPSAALDVLHHHQHGDAIHPALRNGMLVMQYIQCCGGSGLIYETKLVSYFPQLGYEYKR